VRGARSEIHREGTKNAKVLDIRLVPRAGPSSLCIIVAGEWVPVYH
jgi:hypothetical protein